MKKKYYKILMEFTQGTTPCRRHLVRRYGEALVNEVIDIKAIIQIGTTDDGDPQYAITDLGKEIRDK